MTAGVRKRAAGSSSSSGESSTTSRHTPCSAECEVAQCQHDRRARALAAQEARLARGAQHERVERIVQRLAELDAEIGGGAMQDFAAGVIERDRAITRVRQRLLQVGDPARRNFNDLLVEHRRADGRLACI